MTDDLSLRLAEYFEPKPRASGCPDADNYIVAVPFKSLGGWWIYKPGASYAQDPDPVPYTDPEITVRLLKWLATGYDFETVFQMLQMAQAAADDGTVDVLELVIAQAVVAEIERKK